MRIFFAAWHLPLIGRIGQGGAARCEQVPRGELFCVWPSGMQQSKREFGATEGMQHYAAT